MGMVQTWDMSLSYGGFACDIKVTDVM